LKQAERFKKLQDKYQNDLESITEGVLLNINEQIVRLLERNRVTRSELAEKLGVSNAYITKLLNGNENLTIKQLVRLAVALGCTIDVTVLPKRHSLDLFPTMKRQVHRYSVAPDSLKTRETSPPLKKK
jgi:transcriptional regulator with XRE-family HTH domain